MATNEQKDSSNKDNQDLFDIKLEYAKRQQKTEEDTHTLNHEIDKPDHQNQNITKPEDTQKILLEGNIERKDAVTEKYEEMERQSSEY